MARRRTAVRWAWAACLALCAPVQGQLADPAPASLAAPPAAATPAPRAESLAATTTLPEAAADIRLLEQQVQLVLGEARRQQEQMAVMRQRLAAAEAANAWLPWLVLGLMGTGTATALLGLRLWRLRRQQPVSAVVPGQPSLAASASTASAVLAPERPLLSGAAGGSGPSLPGALSSPEMTLGQPRLTTVPVPSLAELAGRDFSASGDLQARPVSVEEMLDLDQQVEFFLALGQAQSAIELLLGHVRASGGASAQPYFRLLEIYKVEGDEEAYDRTRERFNQRFNAHVPEWSGSLEAGRALEDYPLLIERLQLAWPQPLRAMAELDALLLRRADLEPLDLPAYRDLLLLHAMVRDLPAAPAAAPVLPSAAGAMPPVLAAAVTAPGVLNRELPLLADDAEAGSPPPMPARPRPAAQGAATRPQPEPLETVDLLLPLGDHTMETTEPRPHLSERDVAQAMLADWVFSRSGSPRPPFETEPAAEPDTRRRASAGAPSRPAALDLDLSDFAPAPREFTLPAAFTDIDIRRDRLRSDLGRFDGPDSEPAPLPGRRG